jgi:hypothetical protein
VARVRCAHQARPVTHPLRARARTWQAATPSNMQRGALACQPHGSAPNLTDQVQFACRVPCRLIRPPSAPPSPARGGLRAPPRAGRGVVDRGWRYRTGCVHCMPGTRVHRPSTSSIGMTPPGDSCGGCSCWRADTELKQDKSCLVAGGLP